jgi:hypothetical protein
MSDLLKYIKTTDKHIFNACKMLLNSSYAISFTIGSNNIKINGFPCIMSVNTSLISEEKNIPILAKNIEITEEELPGLLNVWLFLNGIITVDSNMSDVNITLTDAVAMNKWLAYFNVKFSWINDYMERKIETIKLLSTSHDNGGVIDSLFEVFGDCLEP